MTAVSSAPGTRPVPHENAYWLPGRPVLAGEYPFASDPREGRARLRAFLDAGVTCFIDLTEAGEYVLVPYEPVLRELAAERGVAVDYRRLAIPDMDVPAPARMAEILDAIDSACAAGRSVYVHCWGGVGRTGAVVGCHLVRHGRAGDDALALVESLFATMSPAKRRRHPWGSPQTDEQRAFVRGWHRHDATRRAPDGDAGGASRHASGAAPSGAPDDATRGRRTREHFRGCLLGGAVGDALGWPVEFMSLAEIHRRYGRDGIRDLDPSASGGLGAVTDDTQMTMFTAEGLLRAVNRARHRGVCSVEGVVWHAYHRWMLTQRERPGHDWSGGGDERDGWLVSLAWGDARRAPGTTCLAALRGERMGTREEPLNGSKGCGGVMRAAPVGLLATGVDEAFETGCDIAAVTHGHPTGWIAAGALAVIVQQVVAGAALEPAVEAAIARARQAPAHEETVRALEGAVRLSRTAAPSPETVERLGGGWVAEEALAIAVYCALAHPGDLAAAVRLAVNHSGDSDSTGAIAGNILGALLGEEAIPAEWRERVEHRDALVALADDLLAEWREGAEWWERYPGW